MRFGRPKQIFALGVDLRGIGVIYDTPRTGQTARTRAALLHLIFITCCCVVVPNCIKYTYIYVYVLCFGMLRVSFKIRAGLAHAELSLLS